MRVIEAKATEYLPQLHELLAAHADELTTHKHLMVVDPDVESYRASEAAGLLFTLLALDGDTVVGYSINVLTPKHPHYSGLCLSHNDVLFLDKTYRTTSLGPALMDATRAKARGLGAALHLWHAKPNTALEHVLRTQGVPVQDLIFAEEL